MTGVPSKRHTEGRHTTGDDRVMSKAEATERLGPPKAGKGRKDPPPTPPRAFGRSVPTS